MKPIFLPKAEEEFREAVRYYENEAPGLGLLFITEVQKTITFITENVYASITVGSGIRKKVINHFPYSLLYALETELIVIVAVAHQKRRPRYWEGRIKEIKEQERNDRKSPEDYQG